jgi:predicted PurR-regulated permease PerM
MNPTGGPDRAAVGGLPEGQTTMPRISTGGVLLGVAWQRAAVVAVCASAALFVTSALWQMLSMLAPVLGVFFGGWLISCVLEPLVTSLVDHAHLRRPTAIAATYLVVLLALVLVWAGAAPILAEQISTSGASLPALADAAANQTLGAQTTANAWLADHAVALQIDLASRLSLESLAQQARALMDATQWSPMAALSGALGVLGGTATMRLLSVFFLIGGRKLAESVAIAFGVGAERDVRFVLTTIHDAFDGFIRAQILQGLLFAAGVWACLAIAHVDAAPLLGASAGVLLLVPVLGAVLALVPPLLATVLWHPQAALAVLAVLIALEQLVLNVVGPRLMSRQLGLPPLLVLFGVLAGGQVGGLWGAVFGVPILAAVVACGQHFRRHGPA